MEANCTHKNWETMWTDTVYTIDENDNPKDIRSSIRKRCLDCEYEWSEDTSPTDEKTA